MLRPLPARKSATPAFRPRMERLDDRITPTAAPFINFADQQAFAAGTAPVATAVGDLNGDGKPDIVTLSATSGAVSVLLNTTPAGATTLTFAAPQAVDLGVAPPFTGRALAVGDLNGDGRPDIVVVGDTGETGSGVLVGLLNTTAAGATVTTFTHGDFRFPPTPVSAHPVSVALGDFDGDGRLDIATADSTSNAVTLLMNAMPLGGTQLALNPFFQFAAGLRPAAITVGDFNADGRLDIAVTNRADSQVANQTGDAVSVLLNTTAAEGQPVTFTAPQSFAVGANPVSMATADFDRDGRPDLVVANAGAAGQAGTVTVLLSTTVAGSNTVSFAPQQNYFVGVGPTALTVGDFGGTGFPSIAVTSATDRTVSVLQNIGGSFLDQRTYAVGAGASAMASGDFNGDGRPELVAANSADGTVSVLRNTSFGGLSQAVVGTSDNRDLLAAFGSSVTRSADSNWQILQSSPVNAVAATSGGGVVFSQPPYHAGPALGQGADFIGGIWHFTPTGGWQQLASGVAATALTIDPLGNVWASFAGSGVAMFRRPASYRSDFATGTWAGLPGMTAAANLLAVSANGDVFADFTGLGVYRYRSITGWQQINGYDATSLSVDANGSVVANFAGFGVGQYIPYAHGWRLLSSSVATALTVDASGTVFASLEGGGISRWSAATSSWTTVAASAPATSLATDMFGNVYLSSTGYGVWKFVPGIGWTQVRTGDAGTLGVFPAKDLYGPHDTFAPPADPIPLATGNAG